MIETILEHILAISHMGILLKVHILQGADGLVIPAFDVSE